MTAKHYWLLPLMLVLSMAACGTDDDDNDASPADDDDTSDDDTSDDDTSDDDTSDDDTSDDDTSDDDNDDNDDNDNDVTDDDNDDDASPTDDDDDDTFTEVRCENPFGVSSDDACVRVLSQLYCINRIPLIVAGEQYGQNDAIDACQAMATDIWIKIHDCADSGEWLVPCLQQAGVPPDYPEVFDSTKWNPTSLGSPSTGYQALNLLYYEVVFSYWERWDLFGGIIDPSHRKLRFTEMYQDQSGGIMEMIFILASGDGESGETETIILPMHGTMLLLNLYYPTYETLPYDEELIFTATDQQATIWEGPQ